MLVLYAPEATATDAAKSASSKGGGSGGNIEVSSSEKSKKLDTTNEGSKGSGDDDSESDVDGGGRNAPLQHTLMVFLVDLKASEVRFSVTSVRIVTVSFTSLL